MDVLKECEGLSPRFTVSEVDSPEEALRELADHFFTIVFVNLSFNPFQKMTLLETLRRKFDTSKLIITITNQESPFVLKAYELGVRGILNLNSPVKEFKDAVRTVMIGDQYFTAQTERFIQESLTTDKKISVEFSWTENQLVYLRSRGKKTYEAAAILQKSASTIETYRCRLLKKANVKNTSELIDFFHQHQLLQVFAYEDIVTYQNYEI